MVTEKIPKGLDGELVVDYSGIYKNFYDIFVG